MAFVEAIQPHISRQVWAMIQLQLLTGARSGEICMMRTCDIDTKGRVWCYVPSTHKTEGYGRERRVYLGPKAIEIVKPWLRAELGAYLFSPAEAMTEKRAGQREQRKTPVQP